MGVLGAVRVGVGVRRRILMRAVGRKMGRMLESLFVSLILVSVTIES